MRRFGIVATLNLIVVALLYGNAIVYAQNLIWAKRGGGPGHEESLGLAVDSVGNSYVTGVFEVSATFGLGETNETTLISTGFRDIFIGKYDTSGLLLWAKQTRGPNGAEGTSIAVDVSGNIYIGGVFFVSAVFGLGEVNETTLISAGIVDIFIAKYD